MNTRKLMSIPLVLATVVGVLACGSGDGERADEAAAADEAAQAAETLDNPRFGVWQLESDRPPPYRNVMTYEPHGNGGMKITVATTNAEGETSSWGYVTMFDGEFHPVEGGGEGATTAVEVVDDRTNRILNARDGEVYQVIINVLSEDGNTINNEYRRTREDGTESVSHAVYRRIE
ncbi:MAG: hypothetical protein OXL34_01095 [Gemmatimonadota bacterium]|nr:hypothetical protein [Gemmatimonadota bacterium]